MYTFRFAFIQTYKSVITLLQVSTYIHHAKSMQGRKTKKRMTKRRMKVEDDCPICKRKMDTV